MITALVLALAAAGTAFASGGGLSGHASGKKRTQKLHACVEQGTNELVLTKAGASCPAGERKVSWVKHGATRVVRGHRGRRGRRGATGAQGKTGPAGPAGATGATGAPGAKGATGATGPPGTGLYGYVYDLNGSGGQTVVGGADVAFSNNGPLSSITHTAGTTTVTIGTAGTYKISFNISYDSGVGADVAIAVNGVVDASTNVPVLTSSGEVSGSSIMTLAAGDSVTLRDNSATSMTTDPSPSVGAAMTLVDLG